MKRWFYDAEIDPLPEELQREQEARRLLFAKLFSVVAHVMLGVSLLALELNQEIHTKLADPPVDVTFSEPPPPPKPKPELFFVAPPPRASQQPPAAQRPPEPAPPATQSPPAPGFQQPAPPPPPKNDQLFGWKTHGEKPGAAVRPPGPETGVHGPNEPGLKGEGRKDAQGGDGSPALRPTPSEYGPGGPGTGPGKPPDPSEAQDSWAQRNRASSRTTPIPGGGSLPQPQQGRGGREGAPGTGVDFNIGKGGGMFGDIQFESGDYNWSDYSSKAYWAIYRAWLRELYNRVPRFERDQAYLKLPMVEGEVQVRFTLTRPNGVEEIEILSPSVYPALNEGSTAALRRVVMPPLPSDFPRDRERVIFRFVVSGFHSARELQYQLEWSRDRGEF